MSSITYTNEFKKFWASRPRLCGTSGNDGIALNLKGSNVGEADEAPCISILGVNIKQSTFLRIISHTISNKDRDNTNTFSVILE